jgi:hypothetical protein
MFRFSAYIFIIVFLLTIIINAADWYVDNKADGDNNGTSQQNAWQDFESINWSSIKPGDVLIIAEGKYYERLNIKNVSGTAASPIVIKGSGKVIIDAEGRRRQYAIFQERCSYVTVQDLILKGGKHYAYRFRYNNNCKIINVDIPKPYADGISLKQNSECEVAYCNIQTPTFVAEQSDCISSHENKNNVYHHNKLAVYNSYDDGHNDCIQMYKDHSTIVYNNYIIQWTEKTHNSQGIYSTTGTGVHKYYNNVINMHNTQSNGLTFRRLDGTGTVEMYNNIVFGKRLYQALYLTETDDPVVKNNIFVSNFSGTIATIKNWNGSVYNIDNNIFYSSASSKVIKFNGSKLTWEKWQSLGFDKNGFNKDPNLKGDILIPASEFIKETGVVISSFDFDFNDKQRSEKSWSIGAYE